MRIFNSQYANFLVSAKRHSRKHMSEVIGKDNFEASFPLHRVMDGQAVSYEAEREQRRHQRQMQISFAPDIDALGFVKGSYAW